MTWLGLILLCAALVVASLTAMAVRKRYEREAVTLAVLAILGLAFASGLLLGAEIPR